MAEPNKPFHIILQTILFTITLVTLCCLQPIAAIKDCPASCKCSWILDSLEVNCINRGLIEYPNFDSMPIERVDLSSNYFVEFPSQLSSYDSLIYLDLSNNHIEYLDANALDGFNALRTLIMANNSINSWLNLNPNFAFVNAVSLQRLVLNGNSLQTFDATDHQQVIISETLIQLDLENCAITQAGGEFLIENIPNLERLNLNGNPLGALTALPSKSLRVLELKNCNLQKIPATLMDNLPALEYLQLSWNTALRMGTSERLESFTLNELDLSYCSLDEIDVSVLPNLQHLRLRGNMLRSLTRRTFENNTLLENLDMSRNSLRSLETETFYKLKKLSSLDLAYNEIARLDRNVFRANDNLVSLNLSHNVLDKFTKIISNSLREINFSWCEIISIDGTAFSSLSSLQRLDLSNNLIRDLPAGMRSDTLQKLDLSNCRLSAITNATFQHFSELAQLKLNGNRFTNPFPREFFRSNKYLDAIWVGDNTWICDCSDLTFVDFYDYLTVAPARIKDRHSLRCASPTYNYGKTWQAACENDWIQNGHSHNLQHVWSTIMVSLLIMGALIFLFTCFQKYMAWRRKRSDADEYRRNHDEMREIRRLNQRILDEEARPNAPNSFENNLPSYEDALRMPKPVRPVKSMLDLTEETHRRRRRLRKIRTNPEQQDIAEEEDLDIQYDYRNYFRSEEMLTNRDLERVQQMDPNRRTGRIAHNNSGSRRFSIEDSRFPAAHLKAQNLQSAEKIGNFQSYENSPYTKRKPKIAEIPPFKRANLRADSVEFLTDPEYESLSKPSSPFARRKPKAASPTVIMTLDPAVEDYFSANNTKNSQSSPEGSGYHIVIEPDIQSLKDIKYDTTSIESNPDDDLIRGKRKKLRNSSSRRASGSFIAAAAASGETSDDDEPVVVVHRPMRETLF